MYKLIWDLETRGILLTEENINNIFPPRPVFYEELDLLGFNKFWQYPKVEEPLLWAIGRRYYYEGKLVGEASGGGIFEPPKIKVTEEGINLTIKPVDIKKMLDKNQEYLNVLINEAIDFIADVYDKYKKKVDQFVVSFSGGKDSQVVLDLVSRTLSPTDYIVVFTDTTMELPTTYDVFEKTKVFYQNIYPSLKFYVARNERPASELWEIFGPPSRIMRWCCSVYKTAPVVRLIRSLNSDKKRTKILVFDGVRADESLARTSYARVAEEMKHNYQINAEPIKMWNQTEVFLYIFFRNLFLNIAYRYGLNRVGCSICPFASEWSEFIINNKYSETANKFLKYIENYLKMSGNIEENEINSYIVEGRWKKRGGGVVENKKIEQVETDSSYSFLIEVKNFNNLEWLKILCLNVFDTNKDKIIRSILFRGKLYKIEINLLSQFPQKIKIYAYKNFIDNSFYEKLRKILYKVTYCVSCGVCEVECTNKAIQVVPYVKIDKSKCINCYKCLDFIEFGCLRAKSLYNYEGSRGMKKNLGFGKYLTFGIRDNWLKSFINNGKNWFQNHNLGNKQFDSMIAWLKDCELIDKNKEIIKENFETIQKIFMLDPYLGYQILWINLFNNSSVVNWYLCNIKWNTVYSFSELKNIAISELKIPERTIISGLNSLLNMFEHTPYGSIFKFGYIEKKSRERIIKKIGYDDIHPYAILYSLYRYAFNKNKFRLTLSELYKESIDDGPYLQFGISVIKLKQILISLKDNKRDLINVELSADLDNINLIEDFATHFELLKYLNG